MRHPNQRNQSQRYQPRSFPPAPKGRQRKEAQPERDVVVHKTHLEGPAIRKNRKEWGKLPRCPARRHANQNKRAPEKRQYGERYGNSFGSPQAERGPQPAQKPIEQYVVPLPRDPKSGSLPLPDQLRQPR